VGTLISGAVVIEVIFSLPGMGTLLAVAFALAQRGKPFRWAAEGPDAYDCSGLMWASWQAAGVTIPRTAQGQLEGLPRVGGRLRPGDLVVYRSSGPTRRHVAMVAEPGRMVEAPYNGVPVRVVGLRGGYLGAVRPGGGPAPSRAIGADIPRDYLRLYQQAGAGERWGGLQAWAVLAGIGAIESDHGRAPLPGVRSGVNSFGCCAGPMQFNLRNGPPSTWDSYGRGNVYDPADAIPAAARYLRASGANQDLDRALLRYNNSSAYVIDVKYRARRYQG
jgi:hypothetical protein